jgi:outer membrane receptor protein involved in Fe transport
VNYPEGEIFGLEFETRLKAGDINENFQGLTLGFNMTVLKSEVTLPKSEQESFEQIGFPITTRDMSGTPAFLMNANVAYEFEELGTQVALFYTVTGDTLETGAGVDSGNFVPSIYALSYGTLNFTLGQKIGEYFKLSFQAKNILNPEIQTVYRSEYLPDDILSTSFTAGVDYTLGLSFRMEF